jgi:hypothetical protein
MEGIVLMLFGVHSLAFPRPGIRPARAIDCLVAVYENRSMKRIVMSALIAAALVLTLGCAPKKSAASAAPPAPAAAARASVVFFEGEVKIDGTAAEIGRELGAKADVETGPNASCDIVFDGKNAVRVGQSSSVLLDFSGIVKEVSIKKGGLTSVLRKLSQVAGSDSFRVTTPTAVAGVRGTSFCVWVEEGLTYVCACNGSVRTIDAMGANALDLSAAHHTAREYTKKGAAILVTNAGVEHHDDASVESLAARIGEKIDWTKQD